jgi:antitoxin FitA
LEPTSETTFDRAVWYLDSLCRLFQQALFRITVLYFCIHKTLCLEQRAIEHGQSIEAEIKAILQSVLTAEMSTKPNLAKAIEKHFVHLDGFELPEITREPMRTTPTFE